MVKLVFCLHRLPGLSREEFHKYWKDTHAPLVRRFTEALEIQRYVQLHTREDPLNEALRASRGAPEAYDGGPLALVQDGDLIEIAIPERRLDLLVKADTLAQRRRRWRRRESPFANGFLALYAQRVGPADRGAVLR